MGFHLWYITLSSLNITSTQQLSYIGGNVLPLVVFQRISSENKRDVWVRLTRISHTLAKNKYTLKNIMEIIYFKRIYLSANWMQCFQTLNSIIYWYIYNKWKCVLVKCILNIFVELKSDFWPAQIHFYMYFCCLWNMLEMYVWYFNVISIETYLNIFVTFVMKLQFSTVKIYDFKCNIK